MSVQHDRVIASLVRGECPGCGASIVRRAITNSNIWDYACGKNGCSFVFGTTRDIPELPPAPPLTADDKLDYLTNLSGACVVVLTPPKNPAVLADALWTCVATCGPWSSGPRYSYHAPTACAMALSAVADAIRADFPRAHGWKAPTT